jgi:anti-sigma B factor antagonist
MSHEAIGTCNRHSVISLEGEIDMSGAPALRTTLMALVDDATDRAVILDLAGVTFMDSSGVGALLTVYRALQPAQRSLVIANAQRIVARVLDLTNVDTIIPMLESVDAATGGCSLTHLVRPVRRLDTAV